MMTWSICKPTRFVNFTQPVRNEKNLAPQCMPLARCTCKATPEETGKSVGLPDAHPPSFVSTSLDRIKAVGIIACLRAQSAEVALAAARAALNGGVTVLEITMTTPSASQVIEKLVQEYPTVLIGAGTVLSMDEAQIVTAAGAKFMMSPVTVQGMVSAHCDGPVLFIPGAMTPTEVVSAYNLGASVVKLYPVALVGGTRFVQALSLSLRHIPLIASHGITLNDAGLYIEAGASAVVLSDAIFDKMALKCLDYEKVRVLARTAVSVGLSAVSQKLRQVHTESRNELVLVEKGPCS